MPSKLDEFLNSAKPSELDSIREAGEKMQNSKAQAEQTNEIQSPAPVSAEQVNTSEPKLDENVAEHIQNVNNGEGNNYQTKKDSLANYPTREPQEQTVEQEQEIDR